MAEFDNVFSGELPMPRHMKKKESPSEVKPKRKYTRKIKPEVMKTAEQSIDDSTEFGAVLLPLEGIVITSGVEYINALRALLELLLEPQRSKLVDFIIENKIV